MIFVASDPLAMVTLIVVILMVTTVIIVIMMLTRPGGMDHHSRILRMAT